MPLKLLLDENIRKEVAFFLEDNGFDIKRLPAGSPDKEIAEFAKKEHRIIVTQDLDFANIFLYPPEEYTGIIVIRILPPLVSIITNALNNFFQEFKTEKQIKAKLIIIEPNKYRIWEE